MPTRSLFVKLLILVLLPSGCTQSGGVDVDNICSIYKAFPKWKQAANAAAHRHGVPAPLLLAVIHQESRFVADARPQRDRFLGFLPGPRLSTAYGFAQALDATWENYVTQGGYDGADRDRFSDAVDFVGWYLAAIARRGGIPVTDGYRLYLAYHEGYRGYSRGSWRRNPVLIETAKRVARQAQRYQRGAAHCR